MKFSVDLGRWTTTKAALAVAGALAIGGAVGSAIAVSPTIDPPIRWAGGVEAIFSVAGGSTKIYTVPAGANFMLTDLIISSFDETVQSTQLFTGQTAACTSVLKGRLNSIAVPPLDVTHLSLETGIGFAAGQSVCFSTTGTAHISVRGFLFTAAPAS